MESIETIIPDNEGNHLVIVLSFYDDNDKTGTFQIPQEFVELDIADISIDKYPSVPTIISFDSIPISVNLGILR